ncbi:protein ANTAGONIST OF LIKE HETEROCHROMATIN PROTEIN 1-like [Cephus cinctus]|uniref:Putative nuclease HARBI1 n=1 Tax=Cephus cinctus TaxID=211228 RepID=A0AAJ7REP8_CEPCN|nr:protein ANTAGONIST OF LIKE HETEROCHROMATIN PROTEIN 1-like [Cephus cinctus]
MATPDSYRSICEKFFVGRSTALRAVRRVEKALVDLAPSFITWPEGNRVEEVFRGFAATSAFPNVIGAIDSTHINIRAPHNNPECYVNRKGHHSIQLQAVCDHERRFIHCLAGHVGSVHDQRVLRLSELNEYMDDSHKFPYDCHLVGDSAYTIHKHLMIPYRDNGHRTEKQRNYNFCHESARITIERAFGLLKGRFRSLRTVLDMENVDLIPDFIIACCVSHNICLLQNDEYAIEDSNCIADDNDI